jgi:MurNAc alpha-1-phosphate uridylyltransferase
MNPNSVMIFAAGHGTRMGDLTRNLPKPLIPVAGKPLLDYAIELADAAGISRKLVNAHYLAHLIVQHLQNRPEIDISLEKGEALETGGGLKFALQILGHKPLFTLNSDALWTGPNPLSNLAQNWQPDLMQALLSVVPLDRAISHGGRGDFSMDRNGRLTRFRDGHGMPFVYTGAQILQTGQVRDMPQARFSFNLVWDKMIAMGQLFGSEHVGDWIDVGTPQGIDRAEAMLKGRKNV